MKEMKNGMNKHEKNNELSPISHLKYCEMALLQPMTQYQSSTSWSVVFCMKYETQNMNFNFARCSKFRIVSVVMKNRQCQFGN